MGGFPSKISFWMSGASRENGPCMYVCMYEWINFCKHVCLHLTLSNKENLFLEFILNSRILTYFIRLLTIESTNCWVARKFGNVFRFIDDLIVINVVDEFENHCKEIYSSELTLRTNYEILHPRRPLFWIFIFWPS